MSAYLGYLEAPQQLQASAPRLVLVSDLASAVPERTLPCHHTTAVQQCKLGREPSFLQRSLTAFQYLALKIPWVICCFLHDGIFNDVLRN